MRWAARNLLYYLPLTIAEQRGYFKAEGLEVTIVDFAGGSRALQAVVGGSADLVSGAFEHTVNMQFKGQPMLAFALRGRENSHHPEHLHHLVAQVGSQCREGRSYGELRTGRS